MRQNKRLSIHRPCGLFEDAVMSKDSFNCHRTLTAAGNDYDYYSLPAAEAAGAGPIARLPTSLKILLENLLRHEDGATVARGDIEALAGWALEPPGAAEIAYRPARVLMQDFTGVPAVADLAAMRSAVVEAGLDANLINPLSPVDLVIDHSVMVDRFGDAGAFSDNVEMEMARNEERYRFLRWGQTAFDNFRVVPPGTGICHQVNLEHLAQAVWTRAENGRTLAYPDTLVGTDSHTTMINGLGVLGWGVGGIEAEAAMLGQPVSMLIPDVVGFRLTGRLAEGITATDLVLRVVEMLRRHGVVGKFVEFFGDGLDALPLADRATIANMAPEYGATCGFFPIDRETINYLELSGRPPETVALVEAYAKAQGLWRRAGSEEAAYTDTLSLDLATVVPSLAGPKRPQDRVPMAEMAAAFDAALELQGRADAADARVRLPGTDHENRPRRGGHRRHHLLHQHLQPGSDAGGGLGGAEGAGARPEGQALGEDLLGARLQGGDRVPARGGPARTARCLGLQSGGLWLHHLHRQFRPLAGGCLNGHRRRRSGGVLGALRQPQL